jgi:hypothetical protein
MKELIKAIEILRSETVVNSDPGSRRPYLLKMACLTQR